MKKKGFILVSLLFAVLMAFGVGLYLYEVLVKGNSSSENLLKLIVIETSGVVGLIQLYARGGRRKSLDYYSSQYTDEIKNAFVNSEEDKKTLLEAVRKYNENRFDSSIDLLRRLEKKCQTHADLYAVKLFLALALTDRGSEKAAMTVYEEMLSADLISATVYGNLGSIYTSLGMKEQALDIYNLALTAYPDAHIAYNNLAQLEFKLGDLQSAKEHAAKALEISFKNYQAASLLAIIHSIEGNEADSGRYTQMAISAGQNAVKLQQAKAYYKNACRSEENTEYDELEAEDDID